MGFNLHGKSNQHTKRRVVRATFISIRKGKLVGCPFAAVVGTTFLRVKIQSMARGIKNATHIIEGPGGGAESREYLYACIG